MCSTLAEVCGDGAKVLPILVLEQYNAVVQMLLMLGIAIDIYYINSYFRESLSITSARFGRGGSEQKKLTLLTLWRGVGGLS